MVWQNKNQGSSGASIFQAYTRHDSDTALLLYYFDLLKYVQVQFGR